MNASAHGDFLKRAVATVVIQQIALALEPPRTALHEHAFVAAEFAFAELRQVIEIDVHVARDK